jgi:hypothetical protein
MTTERVDDALKELKAALDVEPSPEFAAGVRRRVAVSRRPQPWVFGWQAIAVAATVVAAIVAGSAWRHWARAAGDVPARPSLAAGVTASAAGPRPPATPIAATSQVPRRNSDVLIPQGEIAAMRAMLRAIESGELDVPPETPLELDSEGHVKPLEIPAVTIEPLNPPAAGEAKGIGL